MDEASSSTVVLQDQDLLSHTRRRHSAGQHTPTPSSPAHTAEPFSAGPLDPDTCRICRGEATIEEPLFYPCKCSGSIKYVHQDCLMEWLSHSQKKHCELCKTPFRFTKLYAPSMPKTLPPHIVLSHAAKYVFRNILVWLRGALVISVWLGWLPYLMRTVWSFLFWLSDEGLGGGGGSLFPRADGRGHGWTDLSAFMFGGYVCPSSPLLAPTTCPALSPETVPQLVWPLYGVNLTLTSNDPLTTTVLRLLIGSGRFGSSNSTLASNSSIDPTTLSFANTGPPSLLSDVDFLRNLTRYPSLNRNLIWILEGQIITVLVIVCFILIILVRDYVVQQQPEINMRAARAAEENPDFPPPPDQADAVDGHNGAVAHLREPTETGAGEMVEGIAADRYVDGILDNDATTPAAQPDDHADLPTSSRRYLPVSEFVSESVNHDSHQFTGVGLESSPLETDTLEAQFSDAPHGFGAGPSAFAYQSSPTDSDSTTQGSTVYEYDSIFREAGGDPDRILGIAKERGVEDRLEYWMRLTRARRDRKKERDPVGKDAEGSAGQLATPPDFDSQRVIPDQPASWVWPEELASESNSAPTSAEKGKAKAIQDDDEDDAGFHPESAIMPGKPPRARANTDGPQVHESISPLAHNNWSFAASTSQNSSAMHASEPEQQQRSAPSPTRASIFPDEEAEEVYPTPAPTTPVELPSRMAVTVDQMGENVDSNPHRLAELDELSDLDVDQDLGEPALVRPSPTEWNNLPDFNDLPPPRQNGHHAVQLQNQPDGLAQWLAHLMWGGVDAIDPAELMPPPEVFVDDDDVDGLPAVDDGDLRDDDFEQDREVVEAAVAAGLDPDAIDDAEDLEGVMELLGMRGPIGGLFQNAIFCAFLVSITIFLGVFLPYNVGKIGLWAVANPMRPVRMMISLTKFIQDIALVFAGALSTGLFYILHLCGQILGWAHASKSLAGTAQGSWAMSRSAALRISRVAFASQPVISAGEIRNFSALSHDALLTVKSFVSTAIASAGSIFQFIASGEYGNKALHIISIVPFIPGLFWSTAIHTLAVLSNPGSWFEENNMSPPVVLSPELAYWEPMDRFWAIFAGYIVLCLVATLYVRRGRPFSSTQTGQEWEGSVMEGIHQASGVLKVLLIIGIEMLVFPLYCGLLLDMALLPLFEDTSPRSRLFFTFKFPLTSIFVHWFVGTGYMFHFALFVSMCRKIMRKGVLYFIRDPDDPEFHPVRDVLERNVTTQLRKILFSAFVYGALVIICLGGVVWGLAMAVPNVLPIHYSSNEPVLEFPIDLLFYNFLMPLAVKFFKPSNALRTMYTWWFRKCAHTLRISWFLFGERRIDEEGRLVLPSDSPYQAMPYWRRLFLAYDGNGQVVPTTWAHVFDGAHAKPTSLSTDEILKLNADKHKLVDTGQLIPEGRFVRTPASDQVKIPKGRRVFLDVTENNIRPGGLNERSYSDIYATDQYQFVYIPPRFQLRVSLFIILLWIFAAVTGVSFTIIPLVFGRRMFKMLIPAHIRTNDIYAFSIGIYILGSAAYLIFHLRSLSIKARSYIRDAISALGNRQGVRKAMSFIKQGSKMLYCYSFLLVVLPLLLSSVMELYILAPLNTYMYSAMLTEGAQGQRHDVRVMQTWTIGVLYTKLGSKIIMSWYGDTRLASAVRAVLRRGWLDPDAAILTRAFILPTLILGFLALTAPLISARFAISWGILDSIPGPAGAAKVMVYRLSFPAMASCFVVLWTLWYMVAILRSWRVRIRDEAYLIGERLHNFGVGAAAPGRASRAWKAGGNRL
ncbi:uncharacterized protein E0L32_008626 [Thyridium curvatum]|uniref:RING-type E3 ubiquitin transferase n=1 Tax=Thyridium curvatum TaxID=1093900 RepID=A0A507ASG1_9PEZI|nr:uncharacterized protein E0L32_008626 [Thyridium curvatum]TPX10407.1 hypothetical protein E0L32_008626 [Thyridium curvatum]